MQFILGFTMIIISILNTQDLRLQFILITSMKVMFYLFWIIGRSGMVILFIGRLYYTFEGSIAQISRNTFILILTAEIIAVIMFIGCLTLTQLHIIGVPSLFGIMAASLFLYTLIDSIVNISVVVMFIKLLKVFKHHTVLAIQNKMYTRLMKKYALLSFITVSTTVISITLYLAAPLVIDESALFRYAYISWFMAGFDGFINVICGWLSMGFSKEKYNKYCTQCEYICCVKNTCF